MLLKDGLAWLQVPAHKPVEITGRGGITKALSALRESHEVGGSWILAPDSSTPFDAVIAAIDAARAAQFPHVSIVGAPPIEGAG